MDLLVCIPKENSDSKRLLGVVIACPGIERKEFFHSLEGLSRGLCRPKTGETIVILHITDKKQLSAALSIENFLSGIKLILVLPDRNHQTVSKAHKLFPRYVSYCDSDFSDIFAVLTKMIASSKKCEADIQLQRGYQNSKAAPLGITQ